MDAVENTEAHSAGPHAGRPNWKAIAAKMDGRSKHQCQGRHKHLCDQKNRSGPRKHWSEDEDRDLLDAVENTETHVDGSHADRPNWKVIAARVEGRNEDQCKQRYHRFLSNPQNQSGPKKKFWSEEEDQALLDAVENTEPHSGGSHAGRPNWKAIAAKMDDRNGDQCRQRHVKLKHLRDHENRSGS